ncbi:MAG: acyltransferase family protein [Lachnospiraceae bacterium]|nr:acyltransferase family protein [Lachnospiraceae bacterium]
MKKRVEYFDVVKGIGAFLVLIGHLQGPEFFQYSPYIILMCQWIFSFHMVLFFVISGMLISYKNDIDKDMKDIAKRRFKGIMVPYYWFSFFYMTVVFAAFFKKQILVGTVWLNLWYVFSTYGMNVLWFLPALFFAELLFIFLMKKLGTKKAVIVISIQAAIGFVIAYLLRQGTYDTTIKEGAHELAIAVVRPFIACAFVAIGYFGYKLINRFFPQVEQIDSNGESVRRINIKELITGIVLMIIGAAFIFINTAVDFRSMVFKNVPAYFLCSLTSSFGLILICKNIKPFKLLKFWGVNSLIFMAVHGSETVTYYATNIAMWANQYLTRARGYICYTITVCVILIYVGIMIYVINKFVPFITGKPFKGSFIHKLIKGEPK